MIKVFRLRLVESKELSYEELDNLEDKELVDHSREGSELATEILINRYRNLGKYISSKYFISGKDQDDLEQETLVAIWQAIQGYDPSKGSFKSFVSRAMENRLTDQIRKANTKKAQAFNNAQSLDQTTEYGEDDNTSFGDIIASDDQAIDDNVIEQMLADKVYDFIHSDEVSDIERDVLTDFIAGHSTQEVADLYGMTYKQVNNALGRVRSKIRKKFPSLEESRRMSRVYYKETVNIKIKIRG